MRTAVVSMVVCSAVAGLWAPLALAQQKTVQACRAEWQANKAIFQPKGITEQEYVDECQPVPRPKPKPKPRPKPTTAPAKAPAGQPSGPQ
jgi:DNA-binding protein H-NS